jgi:phosphotransferase system HPr-like phosphotransfer protein
MNKENILNALDQLLTTLQSIKSIIEAADYKSSLDGSIKSVLELIRLAVKKAQHKTFSKTDFNAAQEAIKALNIILQNEKSTNPLISDELISLSTRSVSEAEEIQQLLKQTESPSGKPWYFFILRWLGKS